MKRIYKNFLLYRARKKERKQQGKKELAERNLASINRKKYLGDDVKAV